MRLSLEQIKSITSGACRVFEQDGLIHFRRFTEKQLEVWGENGFSKGITATTGIRLDFITNSANFTFKSAQYEIVGKYEVLVNDQPIYLNRHEADAPAQTFHLAECDHRITLYLPSHSEGVLEYVEIDDGATLEPYKYAHKFMFWGDSLTQGWRSANDSLSYAYQVTRYFNAESVILGVGSARFIPELVDEGHPFKPELIFVAYGTNDWGKYTNEELKDRCKRFMDNINRVYPGIPVIGISPTWRKDLDKERLGGPLELLHSTLLDNYKAHGAIPVCGLDLIPHDPRYLTDPVHPNNEGFGYYARNLIPYVEQVLNNK